MNFEKTLRPLGDRVLVKKNTLSDLSSGGIVISSETAVPTLLKGEVIRCGIDCSFNFKANDTVVFSRYAGVTVDGEELVILKEAEILGVLHKKGT